MGASQDRTGAAHAEASTSTSTARTAQTGATETALMESPPLLADLYEFVMLHRPHGELRASASEPTPNGYRLEVACPWRVVFERWVVPDDAAIDMALLARWN